MPASSYDKGSDFTRNQWGGVLTGVDLMADGFIRTKSISGTNKGLGYATGAGGVVTQATSRATGVTLNTVTGAITLFAEAQGANAIVSFTLTNSAIGATDVVLVNHDSGGTVGAYMLGAQPAAGSAVINITNVSAGSLNETPVIRFCVLKSVNA